MKRKIFQFGLLTLVMAATAATFFVTRSLGQRRGGDPAGTRDWLSLSGAQCQRIGQEDPGFREQADILAQRLQDQQQELIYQIRDENTLDEAVLEQSRRVVETHHDLMRRVVQHLLVVRRHADTQQCLQLRGLCSGTLAGGARGGRHGGQAQMPRQGGQGPHGPGRGQGRGMGMGLGRGMGGRHRGNQLAPALALTEVQQENVLQRDPDFETDVAILTEAVHTLHGQFAQNLTDPNVADEAIQLSLEELIVARARLEQRATEHVLRIRSLLSVDQQQRLIGLSQRGRRCWGGQRPEPAPEILP